MNKKVKIAAWIFLVILATNVYIFFKRNQGYEFLNQQPYEKIYASCDSGSAGYNKWHGYMDIYPRQQVEEGAKFSAAEFGILPSDATLTKVYKIMQPLYDLYIHNHKVPDQSEFNRMEPVQKFITLKENGYRAGEFYYKDVFHFFVRCNNILVRAVHSTGHVNEFLFNEVYLPETKQWAMVDISGGVGTIREKSSKKFLNAGDIMIAADNKKLNELEVNFLDQSMGLYHDADTINRFLNYYFTGTNTLYYFYTTDLEKVYQAKHKLKHYFTRFSWHEIYSHLRYSNTKFYIKQIAALVGLVSFIVLGILYFRHPYWPAFLQRRKAA